METNGTPSLDVATRAELRALENRVDDIADSLELVRHEIHGALEPIRRGLANILQFQREELERRRLRDEERNQLEEERREQDRHVALAIDRLLEQRTKVADIRTKEDALVDGRARRRLALISVFVGLLTALIGSVGASLISHYLH